MNIPFLDSLTNFVSGLGTKRDKASSSEYLFTPLTDNDLLAAYRSAWLPRKVVNIPANDACRNWRQWIAEGDDIGKIEAEEKRLGVINKIRVALIRARLFGGAAVYIGTDDRDLKQPLDPGRIKAGGVRYLNVIDRRQLQAGEIDNDVRSPNFGHPRLWTMGQVGTGAPLEIHPSRLVLFKGAEVPDDGLMMGSSGWGDSVLQSVYRAIINCDSTQANVSTLVFEAKVDVIKLPGFMDGMRSPEYREAVTKRLTLGEMTKGINGTYVMDKEDQYEQRAFSFASLPDIMDRFMQAASGAADIPITRLAGVTTGGLGSSGEENTRNYYDSVGADQRLTIGPAMAMLDECLIRSALGKRPAALHYQWVSLWQPSLETKSKIAKETADTFKVIAELRAIPDDVLSDTLVNTFVEGGHLPGLEAAMEQYKVDHAKDRDEDAPDNPPPFRATDAEPQTLYVSRAVVNADEIAKWARDQGLTLDDNPHVTIAYSRTPVDWMKMSNSWSAAELDAGTGGARMMDRLGPTGESLVLLFNCSELAWRHMEMREQGASWDWPEYQPHITIMQDPEHKSDISKITPYRGKILLGPEIFEEIA